MKKVCQIIFCVLLVFVLVFVYRNSVYAANTLNLSVSYPADIKCGEEVTFKMNASGGSGNYKYRIASLFDSTMASVYDISYGSNSVYSVNDEFRFTFYASGTYYIRFSVMDMDTYQTKMTGLYEYPVVIEDANFPSVEQIVTRLADECEQQYTTDFEKALWLHDWIIDHADYDHSYTYCAAEGVLARGVGTCESYHRAYEMLLNKVGIATGRVEGNGHVWTAAKLDGAWYQIDSTWDDMGASYQDTFYEHLYFGLTDDIMKLVHDEHTQPIAGYECTSLEDNYFIKTGEIKQWSDSFQPTIQRKLAAGQMNFTLAVQSDMPDSCNDVIYNLVAYQLSKEQWGNKKLVVSYATNQLFCTATNISVGGESTPEETPGGGGNNTPEETPGGGGNNTPEETPGGGGNDTPGETEVPLTGKQRFAALLYENALGRTATHSELDDWAQELTNGRTGAEVAYGFLFSVEFQNKNYNDADYVEHLYLSLMGRVSDAGGKAGWVTALANGVSRTYVFKQFINSREFQMLCDTYGIQKGDVTLTEPRDQNYNVTSFVARNYTQFLSRTYDIDGLNNWCSAINGREKTMQEIAYGFVFSTECTNKN